MKHFNEMFKPKEFYKRSDLL